MGNTAGAGDDLFELGGRGRKPIHLPIAGDQRAARHRCAQNMLRQRAVSRPVAGGKGAFYLRIPSVAGERSAPYDAPPSAVRLTTGTIPEQLIHASRYSQ